MEIVKILKKYQILPKKRLGQNFLISKKVLEKIVRESEISKEDIIIEIGAGIGNLTLLLTDKAKKVFAIEKDKRFIPILENLKKEKPNLEIIEGDAIKFLENFEIQNSYKVVANIPYYLTSHLIKILLLREKKPKLILLLIQKEVAERIVAQAPKANFLSNFVQFLAEPKIVSFVSKQFFFPQPKVNSAIIKILPKKENFSKEFLKNFLKILKVGFSHPRKQILNNFSKGLKLEKEKVKKKLIKLGIKPTKRAENLKIKEWILLTKSFKIKK